MNGAFSLKAFKGMVSGEFLAARGVVPIGLPSTSPVPSRRYKRMEDKLDSWRAALLGF